MRNNYFLFAFVLFAVYAGISIYTYLDLCGGLNGACGSGSIISALLYLAPVAVTFVLLHKPSMGRMFLIFALNGFLVMVSGAVAAGYLPLVLRFPLGAPGSGVDLGAYFLGFLSLLIGLAGWVIQLITNRIRSR